MSSFLDRLAGALNDVLQGDLQTPVATIGHVDVFDIGNGWYSCKVGGVRRVKVHGYKKAIVRAESLDALICRLHATNKTPCECTGIAA